MTQLIENKGNSPFLFRTFGGSRAPPLPHPHFLATTASAQRMPQNAAPDFAVPRSMDGIITNFLHAAGTRRSGACSTGG